MRARLLVVLLIGTVAFAAKPQSSSLLPVTSYLADTDSNGNPFYIQSDGLGAYQNISAGTVSDLNVNWSLDLSSSTRTVQVTLSDNVIQPGDLFYTATANPPFAGTEPQNAKLQVDCFRVNLDMLIMQAGQTISCPALVRLNETKLNYYRLDMGELTNETETTLVNVQCNTVASDGNCNDWFVDPISGGKSPGKAVARLVFVNSRNITGEGDFYLTFHYHIARP
ncbi:MAG: hypothetical protein ACRD3E_05925 [Terriglobales bacterium]